MHKSGNISILLLLAFLCRRCYNHKLDLIISSCIGFCPRISHYMRQRQGRSPWTEQGIEKFLQREAGSSPAQPPLPYLSMRTTWQTYVLPATGPLKLSGLGRRCPQLMHKSEDLPYSLEIRPFGGRGNVLALIFYVITVPLCPVPDRRGFLISYFYLNIQKIKSTTNVRK